jgi:hypothetical protein
MAGTPNPVDALPPDQPQATPPVETPPVEESKPEPSGVEQERQSTREWLRSLGVVAGEVATREAPRVERQAERVRQPESTRPVRDTDEVLALLREGDDAKFVEGVVNLSRKRVKEDLDRTERDAQFGNQINRFVSINAPDVPLVVFWSFAEEAERRFPTEVDKQIDFAIAAGRAAMENHQTATKEREGSIRATQEQSDTLDGTPTRQRRRGGSPAQERTTTFVEELLAARAKYE